MAIAAAVLLASCAEGPAGIFSSVYSELEIAGSSTAGLETVSPGFVVRLGDSYYAGIGTLWTKAATGGWTQVPATDLTEILDSHTPPFAGSAVVIGTMMYAAFNDPDTGASLGVWSTPDATTWTLVAGLPTDRELRRVLTDGTTLYAVTENVRSSTDTVVNRSIHYFDGTQFTATNIVANTVIGVPNSATRIGTTVWMAAEGKLLTGTAASLTVLATAPDDWTGNTAAPTYGGLCVADVDSDGADDIVVSGTAGKLHATADGGSTWTTTASESIYANSSNDPYRFGIPTYIEFTSGTTTTRRLLVGTTRRQITEDAVPVAGYLEFDLSTATGFSTLIKDDTHAGISNATNFATSLSTTSIHEMPVFSTSTGKMVFALTAGDGFWSNEYTSTTGTWSAWRRE